MNSGQRTIKILAIIFGAFIILNIAAGIFHGLMFIGFNDDTEYVDSSVTYIGANKIVIDSNTSDVIIKKGDLLQVDTNDSKRVKSSLKDGVLKVTDERRYFTSSRGVITITVPSDIKELDIDTGAGKVEINDIIVSKLDLSQGAGSINISDCKFSSTSIDGGAGSINITNSTLNNFDFESGVGSIDITAYITGNSDIECGVGRIDINLLGNKSDYSITASKGLGSINIDGSSNTTLGNGDNKINIEGGVGSINIDFEEER